MSSDIKISLKMAGIVVGALVAVAPLIVWLSTLIGLPARVTAIEVEQKATREVLIRIDENVKALKEARSK